MASLEELRKLIDKTDDELVAILKRRAELVLQVKEVKKEKDFEIYAPGREQNILDRVAKLAEEGEFPPGALEQIFRVVISTTRSLIGEISVGYYGREDSLVPDAARKQFGDSIKYSPVDSGEELFKKIELGELHYGVLPFETSADHLVIPTLSCLLKSDLKIIAEVDLRQGFAPFPSHLTETDSGAHRFVVVGARIPKPTGLDKTAFICTTIDRPGGLQEILEPFSIQGITIKKIEPLPGDSNTGKCSFFLEIAGHCEEEAVSKAIEKLTKLCSSVVLLGSYPVSTAEVQS